MTRAIWKATTARRRTLVAVFQRGAMDGLNVVPPFGDGHYYDLRPSIGIKAPGSDAASALDLNGYFGLHPALAPLKALYDAGELAVVHAVGNPLADRSHFNAQQRMELAAAAQEHALGGWLARHLNASAATATAVVRAVSVGVAMDQSLAGAASAIAVPRSSDFRLTMAQPDLWRAQLAGAYQSVGAALEQQSLDVFSVLDLFAAAKPEDLPVDNGAQYPADSFGDQMKQAAQYIKADIGVEVICVDIGGWDTHAAETSALPPVLQSFGGALAAFRQDLGARFDDVTVVTMSEFGRRAQENAGGGTDHGHGNAMFVMGGGVHGKKVYSDWPTLADDHLDEGDLAVTTDYRTVLAEILSQRFGQTDLASVFPGWSGTSLGLFG